MSIATTEIQNSDQTGTAGALSRKHGDEHDGSVGEAFGEGGLEKDGANPETAQHNALHLFPCKTLIILTS
jgi:hypothetical protein